MTHLTPFAIDVPQEEIDHLKARLAEARFPKALPGSEWQSGIPVAELARLIDLWSKHNWRNTEKRLNQLPQFVTEIDAQTIHFFHVKSQHSGAVPLMLIHGWPGSVLEFEHLIGPLTNPTAHGGDEDDAFHVVIPALPGFGYSTPLGSEGWTTTRVAKVFAELMTRLGYDRFMVQGGDIGAGVAPEIGRVATDRVVGVHVKPPPMRSVVGGWCRPHFSRPSPGPVRLKADVYQDGCTTEFALPPGNWFTHLYSRMPEALPASG